MLGNPIVVTSNIVIPNLFSVAGAIHSDCQNATFDIPANQWSPLPAVHLQHGLMDALARQLAGRVLVDATEGRCVRETAIDLALTVLACEALEP